MAVFRVERTRDYTVMCNHHLKDSGLSLKAKGLLSMDKARAYVENWKDAYKNNTGLLLFGDVGTGKSFFRRMYCQRFA